MLMLLDFSLAYACTSAYAYVYVPEKTSSYVASGNQALNEVCSKTHFKRAKTNFFCF